MKHASDLLAVSLALAVLPLASGCLAVAGAAAGGAGVAYAMGEFEATVEGGPKQAVEAARRALDELDIHLCLLYTSPSPRDGLLSRMPSSA